MIDFMILAHQAPAQLSRLVARLYSLFPEAHVAVHADGLAASCDLSAEKVIRVPPYSTRWGTFSLVDATLGMLAAIVREGSASRSDRDWIVLLSGTSYPIMSSGGIRRHFSRVSEDAVIDARRLDASSFANPYTADYAKRFRGLSLWPGRFLPGRRTLYERIELGGDVAERFAPFSASYRPYGGSQWFAVNYGAAETLLALHSSQTRVARHFRRTFGSDEGYPHTLLGNSNIQLNESSTHYVKFDPVPAKLFRLPTDSPRWLGILDLNAVFESGFPFARKFDLARDRDVVEAIDERCDSDAEK